MAAELGVRGVSAVPYMPSTSANIFGPYCIRALGGTIRVDSPLAGAHQRRNLALAIAAAVELACNHGFPVTPGTIAEGIRKTRWPGRLERIQRDGVVWILDVAHNPAGVWALRGGLSQVFAGGSEDGRPRTLIFSCLRDKPASEMAQILFPLFDQVILAPIHSARGAAVDDLLAAGAATGVHTVATASVEQAMQLALEQARKSANPGAIIVSGSASLVGEVRTLLLTESGEQS